MTYTLVGTRQELNWWYKFLKELEVDRKIFQMAQRKKRPRGSETPRRYTPCTPSSRLTREPNGSESPGQPGRTTTDSAKLTDPNPIPAPVGSVDRASGS